MFIDRISELQPFWGDWKIESEIGKGSFGSVYRISRQDYTFVNMAAMKAICVPKDQKEYDLFLEKTGSIEAAKSHCDNILNQILNEIKLMNLFKGYTNIVSMEDYFVVPSGENDFGFTLLIRMELCKTVKDFIGGKQDFFSNPFELVKLGSAMCEALNVMHSKNVLHRDIKPGNIMVSQDGNYKLGDFGMAGSRFEGIESSNIAGTYDYMAPEVYNHMGYDQKADIYSLGMTLYYFANGLRGPYLEGIQHAPTRGDKDIAFDRRMKNEPMQPPLLAPPGIAGIILRACSFNPNDRFNSALELQAALQAELAKLKPLDNFRSNMSGSVAYNQSISGSVNSKSVSVYTNNSFRTFDPNASKPKKKNKLLIILVIILSLIVIAGIVVFVILYTQDNKNDTKKVYDIEDTDDSYSGDNSGFVDTEENDLYDDDLVADDGKKFEDDKLNKDDPDDDKKVDDIKEDEAAKDVQTPVDDAVMVKPVLKKDITATSIDDHIYKGTDSGMIILDGEFYDGDVKVEGDIVLDYTGKIDKSGEYKWKFSPYLNELYEEVEGTVYIKTYISDMVVGLDEYNKIEDKSEIINLSLEGQNIEDCSFLAEAYNVEKLNLDDNLMVTLDGLEKCTHLQVFSINYNTNLKNIDAVLGLNELKRVYSESTGVDTADLIKLRDLTVGG
ncbi:MAG: protein kinase [Lachnospiraceae bacterium]|nr:protein kinase [Lachnospiraceae bacterium]